MYALCSMIHSLALTATLYTILSTIYSIVSKHCLVLSALYALLYDLLSKLYS